MTHRERLATGAVSEPVPRPATGHPVPARSPAAPEPAPDPHRWYSCLQNLPRAQQEELLSLVQRQGLLYSFQLPTVTNGSGSDPVRSTLTHLLEAPTNLIEPLSPGAVRWVDECLDAAQRTAVAQALATPDVALIAGLPGTGKSRVVAEILTQVARRGERALFVAASAAALDRVLEQFAGQPDVCPVRCLGRDERPEDLPAAVRAMTMTERVRQLGDLAIQAARRDVVQHEQQLARLQQDEAALARFGTLLEQALVVDQQLAVAARALDGAAAEVETAAAKVESGSQDAGDAELMAGLTAALAGRRQTLASIAERRAAWQQRLAARERDRAALDAPTAQLTPLVDAKRAGRWWTGAWWRATLQRDTFARFEELSRRREEIDVGLAELQDEKRRLAEQEKEAAQQFLTTRARLAEAAVARRRQQLEARQTDLHRDRAALDDKARVLAEEFQPGAGPPPALTPAGLAGARAAVASRKDEVVQALSLAREWASNLEQQRAALPGRVAGHANVVAARLPALAADEYFGASTAAGRGFDVLVVKKRIR